MFFKPKKATLTKALHMAWSAMTEAFFMAFVGLIDSFMVSNLGPSAVASVGITTQPKFIGLSIFIALTAFCFAIISTAIISILMVAFAENIMKLCGATTETLDGSVTYFSIIMGGIICNVIQMTINAAQRGSGNTRITMRTNVTSNLINVIGNDLLIGGHLGFPALGINLLLW